MSPGKWSHTLKTLQYMYLSTLAREGYSETSRLSTVYTSINYTHMPDIVK